MGPGTALLQQLREVGRHTDISLTMPPKRTKKTEEPVEEPAKAAKRAKASAPAASKTLTIEACKS